jgi:hypothetical protein
MTKFALNDQGDLIATVEDDAIVSLRREDGTVLTRLHPNELSRLVNLWEYMQDINDGVKRWAS